MYRDIRTPAPERMKPDDLRFAKKFNSNYTGKKTKKRFRFEADSDEVSGILRPNL